jgi:hypothetical protein
MAVYNVIDFGAVGDGIADDTAAITAANAAACDGSCGIDDATVLAQGVVYFPAGSYKHTGLTYLGAPWVGAGRHITTLYHHGSGPAVDAVGTNARRKLLSVTEMRLDGANATRGARGIVVGYNQRSSHALSSVIISNFPSQAIYWAADSWIMSFYDVFLQWNGVRDGTSAMELDPTVDNLCAMEWFNLVLEINGRPGGDRAGGMDLGRTHPANLAQWSFVGGTWEGNRGPAEVRLIDFDALDVSGIFVEANAPSDGAEAGIVLGGRTIANLRSMYFMAAPGHRGTALRLVDSASVTLDASWFRQPNWGRHLSVEDAACCHLLNDARLAGDLISVAGPTARLTRQGGKIVELSDDNVLSVNAALGDVFVVRLRGNRAMSAPTNPSEGQRVTFMVEQDEVGGRRLTWAIPGYVHSWSDEGNGAGRVSTISFRFHRGRWYQDGAQSPYLG